MLSRAIQFTLLLFALISATSCAFTVNTAISVNQLKRSLFHRRNTNQHTFYVSTITLRSSLSNDEGGDINDELKEATIPSSNPVPQQPPVSASISSPAQVQLDPLFLAVTKMDPQTQRAERIAVPIWGELILDRSLFILLPIAVFALGGIFLSLYVLVNSSDTFVDAVIDTATKQSIPTSSSSLQDGESCRGLCSSQSQDLEGLRSYMNRLGGK